MRIVGCFIFFKLFILSDKFEWVRIIIKVIWCKYFEICKIVLLIIFNIDGFMSIFIMIIFIILGNFIFLNNIFVKNFVIKMIFKFNNVM